MSTEPRPVVRIIKALISGSGGGATGEGSRKNSGNLVAQQRVVNRGGRTFLQTFYIDPLDKLADYLAGFFKTDKEKAKERYKSDYEKHGIKSKFGLTINSWKDHFNEYFMHKKSWDSRFKSKPKAESSHTDSKPASKSTSSKTPSTSSGSKWKVPVMHYLHNLYGGVKHGDDKHQSGSGKVPDTLDVGSKSSGKHASDNVRASESAVDGAERVEPGSKFGSGSTERSDVIEKDLVYPDAEKYAVTPGQTAIVEDTAERKKQIKELTVKEKKDVRGQVLALLEKKGADGHYTESELNLLRQYEGGGGLGEEGASSKEVLSAFYTPQPVIDKMWEIAEKYAPKGADVLEPSSGTGRFSKDGYNMDMREIDPTSAMIAKILNPKANVTQGAFQDMFMKNGRIVQKNYAGKKYDLEIGNPPYGSYNDKYKGFGEGKDHTRYEEYFIERGLDALKDGGVQVFIVPSSFMSKDNANSWKIKRMIAEKGELQEAFRLPNGVFPTTDVGTDILVIKKKKGNVNDFFGSKYFGSHPENVLGVEGTRTGRFGMEKFVSGDISALSKIKVRGPVTEEAKQSLSVAMLGNKNAEKPGSKVETAPIARRVKGKEEAVNAAKKTDILSFDEFTKKYNTEFTKKDLEVWKQTEWDGSLKEGTEFDKSRMSEIDGKIYSDLNYATGNIYEKIDKLKSQKDEIISKYGKEQYAKQEALLEKAIPTFKKVGDFEISPLTSFAKEIRFGNNKDEPLYLWNDDKNTYDPLKNYIAMPLRPGNPLYIYQDEETKLWHALDGVYGIRIDYKDGKGNEMPGAETPEKAEQLLKNWLEITDKGSFSDYIYRHRRKSGYGQPRERSPKYLGTERLLIKFFQWAGVKNGDFTGFVTRKDLQGVPWREIANYVTGEQMERYKDQDEKARISDMRRNVGEKLFNKFVREGLSADEKQHLAEQYNRTFNGMKDLDYKKVPTFVDGLSNSLGGNEFKMHEHQLEGAAFLVNKGNGLLAHQVGFGKTSAGIIATVENMQLGRCKKPVICVPNAVYSTWMTTIKEHFPNLKLNDLGNLSSFDENNPPKIDDNSLTVITDSALTKITFKDETIKENTKDISDAIGDISSGDKTKRAEAKEAEKTEAAAGRGAKVKDKAFYFEDFGFDHITIDECLPYHAKILTDRGLLSIGHIVENTLNVKVLSYNDRTGAKEWKPVTEWMTKALRHTVVKLTLSNGKTFVSTHNHRLWIVNEGEYRYAIDSLGCLVNVLKDGESSSEGYENVIVSKIDVLNPEQYAENGFLNEKDTRVYDLTVEGNHNFYANGVLVSNCHNYKNVFGSPRSDKSSGQGANEYSGISASTSDRAAKIFNITQYIQRNNNDRNVFLLSATPFTNSPVEIYNILSLMARKRLKAMGIYNLQEFMSNFVNMRSEWVIKADKIEKKQVVKEFKNLPALQSLIREFIDFRGDNDVDSKGKPVVERPARTQHVVKITPSAAQQKIFDIEQDKYANADPKKDPGGKLVAINNMRMASLSPKLHPMFKTDPKVKFVDDSPKLKFSCDTTAQIYKKKPNLGQVLYIPFGKEFHGDAADYLVRQGVPRDAIGLINGDTPDKKVEAIKAEFNDPNGKIKVLIGSKRIREGVNLNGNSAVLHNTLLDWNPSESQQVEGRIWRQGNRQKKTHIYYPVLNDSIDSAMYQKHDEKMKRFGDVWSYKGDKIDVSAISPEDLKFDLIKDPNKRAKFRIDMEKEQNANDVRDLEGQAETLKNYKTNLSENTSIAETARSDVKEWQGELDKHKEKLKEYDIKIKAGTMEKDDDDYSNVQWQYSQTKGRLDDAKARLNRSETLVTRVIDNIKQLGLKYENIDGAVSDLGAQMKDKQEKVKEIEAKLPEYIKQEIENINNKPRPPSVDQQVKENADMILANIEEKEPMQKAGWRREGDMIIVTPFEPRDSIVRKVVKVV